VVGPRHNGLGCGSARRRLVGVSFWAGGLKVENVAAAVRIVRPTELTLPSGVESSPEIRDHGLLREFIQEVRRGERNRIIQRKIPRKSMSSILHSPKTAPGRFAPTEAATFPKTLMVRSSSLSVPMSGESDSMFQANSNTLLKNFAGRPTPLQLASRLTEKLGGPRIYSSAKICCSTGAHKNQQRHRARACTP